MPEKHSSTEIQCNERPALVVISAVRNEENLLPRTIDSMVTQTVKPRRWIIVDDGSTDSTAEIAEAAAQKYEWIRVVQRDNRGFRKLGGGVIDAFNAGLETVDIEYDFIAKMDADLSFGLRYIERILEEFARDPRLGSASGKVYRPEGSGFVEEFMIDEMVAGQWKMYRRECFEEIGGLVAEVMWDGIDFHKARQAGWTTRSFDIPEIRIIHHRLMGSSDRNVLRGRLRWGYGQWFMGTHPLYIAASAGLRMLEKPYVIGGVLILIGYLTAAIRRDPRYPDLQFRQELKQWQLGRLRHLVAAGQVR